MKLLIITQKVDINDPILGFFHRWIVELSKHFESIVVICLCKGKYSLPDNVRVLSLGKEDGESNIKYLINFYKYIWSEKNNYDKVLVHMNQEYVLLAGDIWKILGKDVFMWRNHHAGSILTDIASIFCKKIFCPSKFSYTAKYKKTVLMPVGVDNEIFKVSESVKRIPNSVLSLGRISPSKNLDLLVDVVIGMKNPNLSVDVYGDALPKDELYYQDIKTRSGNLINFYKGITNTDTVNVYSSHDIFVNLSSSGMYDKTIFEAMACGCLILASNDNLRGQISDDFIFGYRNKDELRSKLEKLLLYTPEERELATGQLMKFADNHSLDKLGLKVSSIIKEI